MSKEEKLFACYEANQANKPILVVYHGSKPPKSVNGGNDPITGFYEVTEIAVVEGREMRLRDEHDGSPLFAAIKIAFPAPLKVEG